MPTLMMVVIMMIVARVVGDRDVSGDGNEDDDEM